MKKVLVMTTINPPRDIFIKMLDQLSPDYSAVVVGDIQTPNCWWKDFQSARLTFIPNKVGCFPSKHYARKNLGYMAAKELGADWIIDLDDDQELFIKNRELVLGNPVDSWHLVNQSGWINPYPFYYDIHSWPRGLPLDKINDYAICEEDERPVSALLFQGIVDHDPDLDAIFRLTTPPLSYFKSQPACIQLDYNNLVPINSQATAWHISLFPLMYLPFTVNPRFSDILRGRIAQRALLTFGSIALQGGIGKQVRNRHNLLADFKAELELYQADELFLPYAPISFDLFPSWLKIVYIVFYTHSVVKSSELDYLSAFLKGEE